MWWVTPSLPQPLVPSETKQKSHSGNKFKYIYYSVLFFVFVDKIIYPLVILVHLLLSHPFTAPLLLLKCEVWDPVLCMPSLGQGLSVKVSGQCVLWTEGGQLCSPSLPCVLVMGEPQMTVLCWHPFPLIAFASVIYLLTETFLMQYKVLYPHQFSKSSCLGSLVVFSQAPFPFSSPP